MTSFWTISLFWIFVLLFTAVALAFVLPPLLRRNAKSDQVDRNMVNVAIYQDQLKELEGDLRTGDLTQDQYESARTEIEKRLSEDVPANEVVVAGGGNARWVGFVLAGVIPLAVVLLYMVLGRPEALAPLPPQEVTKDGAHDGAAMVAALEKKLKEKPDNAQGWYMLGRSYASLGRFEDSARALAKTVELMPDDSDVLADYADVLAVVQGGDLQGKPLEIIHKALALDPQNGKALNLAGNAAYQVKDYAQAAKYWKELLKLVPADSPVYKEISAAVAEAEKTGVGGLDNLSTFSPKEAETKQPSKVGAAATEVAGMISLSRGLLEKVSPGDTVFVFAKAPQGQKMPLASVKITVGQLPYRFKLDDSMAMQSGDKISNYPEVVVSARVSKSGQAMAQSGDLQGKSGPVKTGRTDVAVVIDSVVP